MTRIEAVDYKQVFTQLANAEAALTAARKLVDEFSCSLEMLKRHGPDYTKDSLELLDASVLSDREDIIKAASKAIEAYFFKWNQDDEE